jgi:hypothetical protein
MYNGSLTGDFFEVAPDHHYINILIHRVIALAVTFCVSVLRLWRIDFYFVKVPGVR